MHRITVLKGVVLSYLGGIFLLIIVLSTVLNTTLPMGTVCCILCCAIVLMKTDLARLGLRRVALGRFFSTSLVCLLMMSLPVLLLEPFTNSYTRIIESILQAPVVDLAFISLKTPGVVGIFLTISYLGCIGVAAEELFFRGVLIQTLKPRFKVASIPLQALAFVAMNMLIMLVASPRDSFIYLVCYTLPLSLGLGWAAYRTESIWPGLCALNLANVGYFLLFWNVR